MTKKYEYKTGDIYLSHVGMFIIVSSLPNDRIMLGNKNYCFKAKSFDLEDYSFHGYWINDYDLKINE